MKKIKPVVYKDPHGSMCRQRKKHEFWVPLYDRNPNPLIEALESSRKTVARLIDDKCHDFSAIEYMQMTLLLGEIANALAGVKP